MPPPQHKERRQQRRRRLLTLPAVCPCESIAPAPLLASLVSLAGDVASGGADAAALRRGAGEAVRIAGLLLALLEALREDDGELPAPRAAVLALSELHVALQKLRLLLGDLGRRGARLWVLMNADLAASELRVALGSVATALDLLPPRGGGDVAELARLVRDHAWRAAARVGPDPEDAAAARSVRSALARFAGGATPDADDAWRALRSVGIATWAGCAEEAAFLESELLDRLDEPDGEEGSDLVLLSALLAFALYCRVALFDRIDDDKSSKKKKKDDVARSRMQQASGVGAWVSPESLQCPITLGLMTDPVTVATGQTYDRAAIKRWVRNNGTCPVTGERLRSVELVPNLAARAVVEQFLHSTKASLHHDHPGKRSSSKHRPAVDRTAAPFGPAAAGGARLTAALLVAKLSSSSSATSPDELLKATYEARKLTKRNALYRSCLARAGAAPWLLHLLGSSSSADVQDNAAAALLNLSKHPAGGRALVESGGIGLVVDAVSVAAKAEARQNAAAVLFYLSSSPEYCDEIARVPESVPTLVRLARDGASYRARKNALVSMHGLLQRGAVHATAVAAGAVPVLAGLLLSGSDDNDLAADAVALLARLAERAAGARAVLAAGSELVTRVVDLLGGEAAVSSAKEHCVALLASLGRHGGDGMVALLGKMPGLMPALYALIADDGGSARAGKKARWLVNEIHRHYEQRQPAPPATGRDRVIRV